MNPPDPKPDTYHDEHPPRSGAPASPEGVQPAPSESEIGAAPLGAMDDQPEQPAIRSEPRQQGMSDSDATLADRIKKSDLLMIVLTGLIALATVFQAVFLWQSGRQADRTVAAAEGLRKALEDSVETTRVNMKADLAQRDAALKQTLEESRKIAQANAEQGQRTLQATIAQAKEAMNASLANAQNDQRAWVGPIEVVGANFRDDNNTPVFLKEGERFPVLGVWITNSGRSIARAFRSIVKADLRRTPFVADYGAPKAAGSISVIQPGARAMIKCGTWDYKISARDIEEIRNGTVRLYLFGEMTYDDIWNRPHFTRFCVYLDTTMTAFLNCDTYNDAN